MSATAALSNHDVATYLTNLVLVYTIVIFCEILLSWVPRMPYNRSVSAVTGFVHQSADPYLRIFRSFIKPIGGGQFAFDLSPVIAVFALWIVSGILIGAIDRA